MQLCMQFRIRDGANIPSPDRPRLPIRLENAFLLVGFTLIDSQIGIMLCMLDWSTCPSVERVAERVSGTWVFKLKAPDCR